MPTEFGTLSSRPVLPPPPPPPVPPFSHVPSTSMITDPPNYVVDAHTHARANSFTLRERPLPQRPDVPVPTPSTLASLNKTQSSRSATPEPSRRAPSRLENKYNWCSRGTRLYWLLMRISLCIFCGNVLGSVNCRVSSFSCICKNSYVYSCIVFEK